MKRTWRLFGEYRPSIEIGDEQVVQSLCAGLVALGVRAETLERLARHLADTRESVGTRGDRKSGSPYYRVFVPGGRLLRRREPQSWAFFLLTMPARQPRSGDDGEHRVVQVFLYPTAWAEQGGPV